MEAEDFENTPKAVIRPRNPGENIKVAETVLKRRDRNLKAAADRAAQIARVRWQQKEYKKGKLRIIRAEKLVKNAILRKADRRRLQFQKKKHPNPKPTRRCKSVAVVRNSRLGGSKEVKTTLRELGLHSRNSLVFLPNTEEIARKLQTCKPFAFWGRATFKTVFNLVHKKAMFKDPTAPEEKVMLSDNVMIEKHLGDLGVLCTEDLAHVLHTCPKAFDQVSARLWPIDLDDAKKANGMVNDKKFTCGDLQAAMDLKLQKLIGE